MVDGTLSWASYSTTPYNIVQTSVFAWSPDSAKIAYVANNGQKQSLSVVNVKDGTSSIVRAESGEVLLYCPIFALDGGRLAFSYQRKERDQNGKFVNGLGSVDLGTNMVTTVLETTRTMRLLDWVSDGTSLIVAEPSQTLVGLPAETSLSKFSIKDGAEIRIANLKNVYFYNIFLDANRKQIAFVARDQNLDDVWVMPALGGAARKISNNRDSGQYFSRLAWLRDGSAIVFGKQTRYSLLSRMTDIE